MKVVYRENDDRAEKPKNLSYYAFATKQAVIVKTAMINWPERCAT
ncbi:hypothetical protein Thi970DRAFT_01876 [Thiorhodovibrio frisius]|uniref:Uncharacterized protein n=1 Tax=Thiorhodovibrio frisius TaxID=631362 RepID=H8Z2S1_9GAMM|nr:hypothetical protein Thi970DRAFT_01876 [Thiorhodovibrio frisius]WPL21625.1 hypothetical protein Thiofri_01751 [Thiorhodovibrio frisius]